MVPCRVRFSTWCCSKLCTSWHVQHKDRLQSPGFSLLKRKPSLSVLVSSGWHHRRHSPCRLLSQTTSCLLSMADFLPEEGGVWGLSAHVIIYQIRCTSGMLTVRLAVRTPKEQTRACSRARHNKEEQCSRESLYRNMTGSRELCQLLAKWLHWFDCIHFCANILG